VNATCVQSDVVATVSCRWADSDPTVGEAVVVVVVVLLVVVVVAVVVVVVDLLGLADLPPPPARASVTGTATRTAAVRTPVTARTTDRDTANSPRWVCPET
jgi:hypothetical protein